MLVKALKILLIFLAVLGTVLINRYSVSALTKSVKLADNQKKSLYTQNLKINEKAELRRTVYSLIELLFRQRKTKGFFEQYFRFSKISAEEKEIVGSFGMQCDDKCIHVSSEIFARRAAIGWNYEYQDVLLFIGTKSLPKFDNTQGDLEEERKRILTKHGLTEKGFYNMLGNDAFKDKQKLEQDLAVLEQIDADLDKYIVNRIDKSVLDKNIAEIKRTAIIKKLEESKGKIYAVGIQPFFEFDFTKDNGKWKIINITDSV